MFYHEVLQKILLFIPINLSKWVNKKTTIFTDKNFWDNPLTFGTKLPYSFWLFKLYKLHKQHVHFTDDFLETVLFIHSNFSQYINWNNHVLRSAYQSRPESFFLAVMIMDYNEKAGFVLLSNCWKFLMPWYWIRALTWQESNSDLKE